MNNILKTSVFAKVGVPKLKYFLDLTSLKHKLTSGNIANVSTPGYKSKDINFQLELRKAGEGKSGLAGAITHSRHIPLGQAKENSFDVIESKEPMINGTSNVNIDKEIASMAMNQLNFSIGARMMQNKFRSLRKAISGRI